eukprot:1159014-Pelagomonas_calceolata.AAC.16
MSEEHNQGTNACALQLFTPSGPHDRQSSSLVGSGIKTSQTASCHNSGPMSGVRKNISNILRHEPQMPIHMPQGHGLSDHLHS